MSEVNVPVLRKVLEWAEAEDAKPFELSEWYQNSWVRPAHTITVTRWPQDGALTPSKYAEAVFERTGELAFVNYRKAPECGTNYCIAGYVSEVILGYKDKNEPHEISEVARKELGLTPAQAEELFASGNSIEDVRRIAEEIAGERL